MFRQMKALFPKLSETELYLNRLKHIARTVDAKFNTCGIQNLPFSLLRPPSETESRCGSRGHSEIA